MKLTVKIFSCYEHTYKRIYGKVIKYLYGDRVNLSEVVLEIIDISENGTKSVQSQRSDKKYFTRALYIYEDNHLKHIVGTSNTNRDYDKKHEKDKNPSLKYIFDNPKKDYHGNAYFKQGTPKLFNLFFKLKEDIPDLKLSFYIFDTDTSMPSNLFNTLTWRELQTIGFNVLNIEEVDFSQYESKCRRIIRKNDISFKTFTKYINDISRISSESASNKPSFLQCIEKCEYDENFNELFIVEKYIYTFKALSAQGYDALFRILCLKTLAEKEGKEIEFRLGKQYFAYTQKDLKISDTLTQPILDAFKNFNCEIHYTTNEEFLEEKNLLENAYQKCKRNGNPRNQSLFRNNLYRKGIPIQCPICGNDDPSLLKAAHIWEVTDINNATKKEIEDFISINDLESLLDKNSPHINEVFYKKYCLTNSGDNGIWLCGTHHDMFDKDYFTFKSENGELILLHFKTQLQKEEFINSLYAGEDTKLANSILTTETKAFLDCRNQH